MDQLQKYNVLKTSAFTVLALVAFAANSVLARMALGDGAIDASGFTVIRLLSGAVMLVIISAVVGRRSGAAKNSGRLSGSLKGGSWLGAVMLFVYAISFSFAYISLDTATGALILFGAVQITMIIVSLIKGNRPGVGEWTGLVLAFGGFVFLILPGISTPSAIGFALMGLSGIAWGFYTLQGRGSDNPLADTTQNFIRTVPMIAIVALISMASARYSLQGIVLGVLSGGIASGIGYSLWYSALGGLSTTQAAVLQLLVPVIAALGGVIFISETITIRLVISAVLILSGILLVVLSRKG